MKILIIRHGDPDYEIDSVTEKGKREVMLLRDRLLKQNIGDIYCSPLGRAKATAEPTLKALGKTAEICDWLREFDGYIIAVQMRPQCPGSSTGGWVEMLRKNTRLFAAGLTK